MQLKFQLGLALSMKHETCYQSSKKKTKYKCKRIVLLITPELLLLCDV